jgi:O-antigen/teichoic acid export membrane protein
VRKSIWREYGQALLAEAISVLLGLAVPAIAARRWGVTGFAEYSIVYRALAFLAPTLLLGLTVSLPRFLGRSSATGSAEDHSQGEDRRGREDYLVAALVMQTAVLGVAFIILIGADSLWSELLFGRPGHHTLLLALQCLLTGGCLWAICSAYLRGLFLMRRANTLLVWYVGVVPLSAILLADSIASVLVLTGGLWFAGSLLAVVPWRWRLPSVDTVRERIGELGRFGIRRVPGEMALFGLFAVPPILATHAQTLATAGYLAFALSLVTVSGSLFTPISLVLLPHASRAMSQRQGPEIRSHVQRLLVGVCAISIVGVVVLEVGAGELVRLYLGSRFTGATKVLREIAPAIPAYAIFISLRSVLDAYHHKAVSVRNAAYAFVFFLLTVAALSLSSVSSQVPLGFVAGLWLLALLTLVDVYRGPLRAQPEARLAPQ